MIVRWGGGCSIRDVPTGKISTSTLSFLDHEELYSIRDTIFSASGEVFFAYAHKGRMARIDKTATILATWKVPEEEHTVLALHPEETILASGGEGRLIHLWDTATGRELAHWEAHDTSITALTFSPDGRTLVSGSADGTLKLWDLPAIRRELAALGLDWSTRSRPPTIRRHRARLIGSWQG